MHTKLQFGTRENPASDRRHGSRLAVTISANENRIVEENCSSSPHSICETQSTITAKDFPHAASPHAATGAEKIDHTQLLSVQEVARLLQVPVSCVYEHTRPTSAAPLPHIKLGKYLRFIPAEIRNFLEGARSHRGVLR